MHLNLLRMWRRGVFGTDPQEFLVSLPLATLPTVPSRRTHQRVNQIASLLLETLQSFSFTQKIKAQVLPMSFEFLVICPLALPNRMALCGLQPPRPSQTRTLPCCGESQVALQTPCVLTCSKPTTSHHPSQTSLFRPAPTSWSPDPGCPSSG